MAIATDVLLRCGCGTVRGVAHDVAPSSVNHCFCYCDDCQAFAHFLDRADEILDAHGGTELAQMSQGSVRFTAGADKVAAIRLTSKGLVRWYASCCKTPIGNTLNSSALPFIGVLRVFMGAMDAPPAAVLGPIRGRGFAKSAKGGRAAVPKDGLPDLVMVARVFAKLIGWRLRGDHKRSPLFAADNGLSLAQARVLTPTEREALRQRCVRWRERPAGGA